MKKEIKNIEYKALLIVILAVMSWLTTEQSTATGGAFLGLALVYMLFLTLKYKLTLKQIAKGVI